MSQLRLSNQAKMSMDRSADTMQEESAEADLQRKREADAEAFGAAVTRMVPENHVLLQEDLQGFQPLQVELSRRWGDKCTDNSFDSYRTGGY